MGGASERVLNGSEAELLKKECGGFQLILYLVGYAFAFPLCMGLYSFVLLTLLLVVNAAAMKSLLLLLRIYVQYNPY